MLLNSFVHMPGVGAGTERRIWASGVETTEQFTRMTPSFLSPGKAKAILEHACMSGDCLARGDAGYFYCGLGPCDQWRMFREFRHRTAYLDIETTGLGSPSDIITTIALFDGSRVFHYVNGENLDAFPDDIGKYGMLVTYNGKTFDVPFINRFFGISLPHAHLDLRYILRSLGFSGGLKSCEGQLGIGRTGEMASVDGFFAVLLWDEFRRTGSRKALETLLAYNIEDTVNLEYLMVEAYNRKLRGIPLDLPELDRPGEFINPFEVDHDTVLRIRRRNPWGGGCY